MIKTKLLKVIFHHKNTKTYKHINIFKLMINSENNLENLNKEIENLENLIGICKNKKIKCTYFLNDLNNQINDINKRLLLAEDSKRKLEFHTLFVSLIENTKNKYNISNNEINLIYDGMDKFDYNTSVYHDEKYHRFIDFDKILINVSKIKNKYNNFKLIIIKKTFSEDCYPPTNYYSYKFEDDDKNIFSFQE